MSAADGQLRLDEPLPQRPSFRRLSRRPSSPAARGSVALILGVAAVIVLLGFAAGWRLSQPRLSVTPKSAASVPARAASQVKLAFKPKPQPSPPLVEPLPQALGDGSGAPGALPDWLVYHYDSSWRGWPLWPLHAEHPVRGSFLAPRELGSAYHFGIDISADDAHPDPQAPPGGSQRVYAVDSGVVSVSPDGLGYYGSDCDSRHFAVSGQLSGFDYWHIIPTVPLGSQVVAGQPIGWTCLGDWHLHLSEWQLVSGRTVWVNPLHKGGKLLPYKDTAAPAIDWLRFYGPTYDTWCPLKSLGQDDDAGRLGSVLFGRVELRAKVDDVQSYQGFLARDPRYASGFTPYRLAVAVWRPRPHKQPQLVFADNQFRGDSLPQTPYLVFYAPGTHKPAKMQDCVDSKDWCGGSFVYRPFSGLEQRYWDTRAVANGAYVVTVYAWDEAGNMSQRSLAVSVDNARRPAAAGSPLVSAPHGPCWQTGGFQSWLQTSQQAAAGGGD